MRKNAIGFNPTRLMGATMYKNPEYSGWEDEKSAMKMGNPNAKSFDWVINTARTPALPKFQLVRSTARTRTIMSTNTVAFAIRIPSRNFHAAGVVSRVNIATNTAVGSSTTPQNLASGFA